MTTINKLENIKIESGDVEAILDFWKHFELETPDYLIKAAQDFRSDQNIETQDALRVAICKAIHEGKEDIFQDELFQVIKSSSDQVLFHSQFKEQLEETLVSDNK